MRRVSCVLLVAAIAVMAVPAFAGTAVSVYVGGGAPAAYVPVVTVPAPVVYAPQPTVVVSQPTVVYAPAPMVYAPSGFSFSYYRGPSYCHGGGYYGGWRSTHADVARCFGPRYHGGGYRYHR